MSGWPADGTHGNDLHRWFLTKSSLKILRQSRTVLFGERECLVMRMLELNEDETKINNFINCIHSRSAYDPFGIQGTRRFTTSHRVSCDASAVLKVLRLWARSDCRSGMLMPVVWWAIFANNLCTWAQILILIIHQIVRRSIQINKKAKLLNSSLF